MQKSDVAGSSETIGKPGWVDPDDAPELTEEFFDNAEVCRGDTFVCRGQRGRPNAGSPLG